MAPLLRPLVDLLELLLNWRFALPLALNQAASVSYFSVPLVYFIDGLPIFPFRSFHSLTDCVQVLFVAVVSAYPISLVVPLTNSLALVFTTLVSYFSVPLVQIR